MYTIFNFIGCEIHSFYDLFNNGSVTFGDFNPKLAKKDNLIMYDKFLYSDQ